MNQDTPTGHAVSIMNAMAAYDAAVKHLLAHKPFLARIMKDCLPEYRDCSIEDIINLYIEGEPHVADVGVHVDETNPRIRGGNSEDTTLTEGVVFYDIRFNALAPRGTEAIGIIINVEAQNRANPGYSLLKRAIYYCSRLISAQKNTVFTGSDYDKLQKVYSIWVCSTAPEEERSTITAYSMRETPLIGNVVRDAAEYDLLSVIMIRLGDVPQHSDGSIREDALNPNVIGMLEVLLKGAFSAAQRRSILQQHYGIRMTQQIEKEVGHMCNLSQGVWDRGMQKGIQQGMQQGMQKGIQQGMQKGIQQGMQKGIQQGMQQGTDMAQIAAVRALMDSLHLSLEQAMQTLHYPLSDKEKFAAALQ